MKNKIKERKVCKYNIMSQTITNNSLHQQPEKENEKKNANSVATTFY